MIVLITTTTAIIASSAISAGTATIAVKSNASPRGRSRRATIEHRRVARH
jgi:hypothetical protein